MSLTIDRVLLHGATIVRPHGELTLSTYARMRDALLKCALELPRAVVVDLDELRVPADTTLVVFSSVRMQVLDWPAVPIVLVAPRELDRRRLARNTLHRHVPLHASIDEALTAVGDPPARRRTLIELPRNASSVLLARRFVEQTCQRWECCEHLPDAILVASELVENAVRHTSSEPRLRLEQNGGALVVAVYDDDPTPVQMCEPDLSTTGHLGLVLVDKLVHSWSWAPMLSGGKAVWAVLRRS
ncbi:MAG TPA: ATP-binding protein [Actinophytocola sp.]|uniref:ATP-binding protein n=1 Tax=Actinophytocola sp. TaxID=1872138 RepID=UPI002DBAC80B|nr:ATP-binding protein [Actinophytocola sp.]HEU5474992.1 ATP-binding protein [Actinophytocola sp.]